ncbi:hypothetical protein CTAYLR_000530 [Chrysophaeum taylorii]|uniref:Smr domain-containing protein n=1 Tax=Chrysophaeum taylorii TaxID=2483200 RepID=A0AAD7XNC7_9STRA|nr:hypothetical protein CTAYLR_000530 [Chrysophaeum taylorii]
MVPTLRHHEAGRRRVVVHSLEAVRRAAQRGEWSRACVLVDRSDELLPIKAYNVAITACGAAGEWRAALRILRSLTVPSKNRPRPDAVTFNAAGAATAKSGRWQETVRVLRQARRYVPPHPALYTSAIACCGRAGELPLALELLAALRAERGVADTVAFTAAIDACARRGDYENAARLYEEMRGEAKPNDRTHRALALAAARGGALDDAAKLLERTGYSLPVAEAVLVSLKERGDWRSAIALLAKLNATEETYGCCVHAAGACAAAGRCAEARAIVDRFEAPPKSPTSFRALRARRAAHTQAIVACGRQQHLGEAVAVFEDLCARASPDLAAFNALLVACRGNPDAALRVWGRLRDHPRLKPDAISVAETIACLDRAGRLEDADRVLGAALDAGIPLKNTVLDLHDEIDVSSLPVPVAKAVVRRAIKNTTTTLHLITGVGRRHKPTSTSTSLRDALLHAFPIARPGPTPGTLIILD